MKNTTREGGHAEYAIHNTFGRGISKTSIISDLSRCKP